MPSKVFQKVRKKYAKVYAMLRRKKGLCRQCSNKAKATHVHCEDCLKKEAERSKLRTARKYLGAYI